MSYQEIIVISSIKNIFTRIYLWYVLKIISIYRGQSTDQHFFCIIVRYAHQHLICFHFIFNPSSPMLFSELMFASLIFIEVRLFWFFLPIIMVWNLSGFKIIMVSLNHCSAFSDSEVKLLINFCRDFSVHDKVLSTAELCNSAFSINENGPKIDPCGTQSNKTWKTLYVLFIFTFCLLPFK